VKERFWLEMKVSPLHRFWLWFTGLCQCSDSDEVYRFKGRTLKIANPSEPINILWENLHISNMNRRVRALISFIATLCLVALPVVIVFVLAKNVKEKDGMKLSCPQSTVMDRTDQAFFRTLAKDYESEQSENLVFCYCFRHFISEFNREFPMSDGSNQKLCPSAYSRTLVSYSLSFVISFLLTICSMAIDFILLCKFS
jgi:hypothetical protein